MVAGVGSLSVRLRLVEMGGGMSISSLFELWEILEVVTKHRYRDDGLDHPQPANIPPLGLAINLAFYQQLQVEPYLAHKSW